MTESDTISQLTALIKQELASPEVNIAKVSIALGAVETPLTRKDSAQREWPTNLLVGSCQTPQLFAHHVLGCRRLRHYNSRIDTDSAAPAAV